MTPRPRGDQKIPTPNQKSPRRPIKAGVGMAQPWFRVRTATIASARLGKTDGDRARVATIPLSIADSALPERDSNVPWKRSEVLCLTLIDRLRKCTSYLTLQEGADLLGIHTMTLRKWAKAGKIQSLRIGDQIKFDPNVLADWLSARSI